MTAQQAKTFRWTMRAAIVLDGVLALLLYYVAHMEPVILLLPFGMALLAGVVLLVMNKKLDDAIQSDQLVRR